MQFQKNPVKLEYGSKNTDTHSPHLPDTIRLMFSNFLFFLQ